MTAREKFSDPIHSAVEKAGLALLILLWIYVGFTYMDLPESIPVHFNGKGEPDSFADKSMFFMLPLLATLLFAGLNWLKQYPEYLNYPVRITEENAARQYRNVRRMILVLNTIIILTFWAICIGTVLVANGEADGLGDWFIPLFLFLSLGTTFYFLFKGYKTG
ncbi:DUF1648 domain-containing protein [Zeaxanthinibacter enoshimensis]|uniref:Uncharacterized protein DUF1648 n=1 Tax=Zeaxanthinibacter enoshimensis TaxID=392009 RepID=A0A4R6TRS7_9FLAO|nr:DUF1648 domain-containing protein [Zeaxanthinibacter enoshimensis]TDQ33027.1 uncharacterized protein DUF1648 [Zeaxanthinibacter enoshimensis]